MAPVRPGAAAERDARRLALRPPEALEPLGTLPDAIPLQPGRSWGAVWTLSHGARRWGIELALGTTRAGQLALWNGSARGSAPGSRLAAVRWAMSHAAWDGLGRGPCAAEALERPWRGGLGPRTASGAALGAAPTDAPGQPVCV
jgi:hypothetical protein